MRLPEIVVWRDAHFDVDERKTRKDYIVKTAGWVTEGPRFLKIVGERTPEGKGRGRAVTHVPNENVVRRIRLEEVK